MERQTISRNQIVNQILKIGHGDLSGFVPTCLQAVRDEPELFAHLIAWNEIKGEIRDSKIAFPVLALRGNKDDELYENAVAHLCLLDPRNLMKSVKFSRELNGQCPLSTGAGTMLKNAVTQYITDRQKNNNRMERVILQHRKPLKYLYTTFHVKPSPFVQAVLFNGEHPRGTVFEALKNLKDMKPLEAAGTILQRKIPFLIATGALGGIKNKPDVIMALIERMSGAELVNNTKMLQDLGVFDNPVLKSTYDSAIERAKKDKKLSTLKASVAMGKITDRRAFSALKQVREEKLDQLGGIDGDWLILGDRSGSMDTTVEAAKHVAAFIAQQTKGQVHLVFFNTSPTRYEVTGKSLEEIQTTTKRIFAAGGTSIGCGLELIREQGFIVNGIVICSDGGDNTIPYFHDSYRRYSEQMGIEPSVYLLWWPGEDDCLSQACSNKGIPITLFDMRGVDYYSLPNIIKTLRSSRYMLIDEIMGTPLLTLAEIFQRKEKVA